jgi:hypothetical protein
MSREKNRSVGFLVLFTFLQVVYLYYTQNRTDYTFLFVLMALPIQGYISTQIREVPFSELKQFAWANSLLIFAIPIFYSNQFIQGLWDAFLTSHGLNPYLVAPNNPQVGRGITTVLYQLLENKTDTSNLAPTIQIILKPFYILYTQTNLLTVLMSFKLCLVLFGGFIFQKFRENKSVNRLFLIPGIWLFGLSQANPELLGLYFLIWGYLTLKDIGDWGLGLAILGIAALFGLPYLLISLLLVAKYDLLKQSWIFLISLLAWIAIPFNTAALFEWAFRIDWGNSLIVQALGNNVPISWISIPSICFISIAFFIANKTQTNQFKILFLIIFLLLSPFTTQTLFGLLAFLFVFDQEYHLMISNRIFTALSTCYALLLILL